MSGVQSHLTLTLQKFDSKYDGLSDVFQVDLFEDTSLLVTLFNFLLKGII